MADCLRLHNEIIEVEHQGHIHTKPELYLSNVFFVMNSLIVFFGGEKEKKEKKKKKNIEMVANG